jgi:hypothetical protein
VSGEYDFEWFGPEIELRMRRATGRAVIAIGVNVAADTKRLTHVISGNLRRSVHTAPADYDGSGDLKLAKESDIPNHLEPTEVPEGAQIQVGSWLPYACVEWIGRGHPRITQGLEMQRGIRSYTIVREAMRQEGF